MTLYIRDYTKDAPRSQPGPSTWAAVSPRWQVSSAPGEWRTRKSNLRWFQENESRLGNYAGLWVAVRDGSIVTSASSFAAVHETLTKLNLSGALIVRVSDNVHKRPRLIA
jgi:hypothetical protein